MGKQATYRLTVVFLYLAIALSVLALFYSRLETHGPHLDLGSALERSAKRPYVYRVLYPEIIRGVSRASDAVIAAVGPSVQNPFDGVGNRIFEEVGGAPEARPYATEYGVHFVLSLFCLLGFAIVLRGMTQAVYPSYPRFVADLAPLIAVSLIPVVFFREANLFYDPLTWFLFSLCFLFILRRRHAAYLTLFPLAVIHKETAILLVILFFLKERGALSKSRLLVLTTTQLIVFAVLKLALNYAFRANPGAVAESHIPYNLSSFQDPIFYVKTLLVVVPFGALIAYHWAQKDRFLRHGFLLTLIPMITLAFTFGVLGEFRDYYEIYPLIYLLALPTVLAIFVIPSEGGRQPIQEKHT